MTEGYLQILLESLEKKSDILARIRDIDEKQLELALKENFDFEAYDETVRNQEALIEKLNKLDDGFATTYELVRKDLEENKDSHREIIAKLQEKIREITDLTVEIQAKEKRNKDAVTLAIKRRRVELKGKHVNKNAAFQYYKNVSQINTVDPQLMDKKK